MSKPRVTLLSLSQKYPRMSYVFPRYSSGCLFEFQPCKLRRNKRRLTHTHTPQVRVLHNMSLRHAVKGK
jgi:hypothetical protein